MADETGAARAPSGTHDVLWPESTRWEALLAAFAAQVERAGYGLAHTPIFEDVRVFRRGIGEGSDVVGKEMYEFEDRGGRALALRPEGTAPMVRAFVQHRPPLPWKAWYATPAFRYERPQAGRYRQHHQLGVEALGPVRPRPRRRGGLPWPTASSARSAWPRSTSGSTRWATASAARPTSTLLRAYLAERRHELCAPSTASGWRPTRCGSSTASGEECRAATAGAPRLVDHLCDPCRAPLRPGPRRAGRPGGALRLRPPAGPRVRLLHPDHLRVRLGGPGVGPERHRRRRPLRRPGGDAGRPAHAGDRLRHRHRAAAAGLRRRGGVRRWTRPPRRLRGRRGRG